ncbi:MAG: hypothetical protein U9R57_14855 [Thermodesulfobacteriota bacterium]|nr:hypothetical protein [Thermodesulfobacteriota bacterium]
MKKQILVSGLSLLIGMGMASTASAMSFEFHGKMWQTIGFTDNDAALQGKLKSGKTNYFGYTNVAGDEQLNVKGAEKKGYYDVMGDGTSVDFGLTKARLRFEGKTDDGRAKFVYGLEVGTVNWGDKDKGFGLSGDGINQETRFAYAQIQIPGLDQNQYLRAGLQPTKINHWLWTETAAGLTYHGKAGDAKWMAGWYRGDEDRAGNSSDNDYYILKGSTKITSAFKMGLFGVYADVGNEHTYGITDIDFTAGTEDQYDDNTYYLGLTGELNGPIFGSFDLIYQGGDIEFDSNELRDLDHSAYLGDLTVGYKFDDRFKVYANFLYVSGDDDYTDSDADNFNSIDVDVKVGIILTKDSLLGDCDRFVTDSPYIMDQGLINYSLTGEFQLNPENHFRAAIRYLQLAEDYALGDDEIGTELDFWYKYKYNKNVALRFEAAYLFADDALAFDESGDDMYTVAAGIQFKF